MNPSSSLLLSSLELSDTKVYEPEIRVLKAAPEHRHPAAAPNYAFIHQLMDLEKKLGVADRQVLNPQPSRHYDRTDPTGVPHS